MTVTSGAADTVSTVIVDKMVLEISFVKGESKKQKGEKTQPVKSGVLLSDFGHFKDSWTETASW